MIFDFRTSSLWLVFEFVDTDLSRFINNSMRLQEEETGVSGVRGRGIPRPPPSLPRAHVKSFIQQLLSGTAYFHSRRVVHRDLKPQNVLVGRNGSLRIADFGLARAYSIPVRVYTHEVSSQYSTCQTQAQQSVVVQCWAHRRMQEIISALHW